MKKNIDTYLFDFDGTLVDSFESLVLVFKGAYEAVGVKIDPQIVLRLMRIPLFLGYEELSAPQDEESKKIFGQRIIELLDDQEVLKATKIYDDTVESLNRLHKEGNRLGIVTSNNRKHVLDVLNFLNIDSNLFSVIVGNAETKRHKPFPDPILKAIEELETTVDKVAYVGDGLDDMRCAVNSGVTPILLDRLNEYHDEKYQKIYSLTELK